MANTQRTEQLIERKAVGLTLADGVTKEQWKDLGRELGQEAKGAAFRIGDFIDHGIRMFDDIKSDDLYAMAEELTGFERPTLYNYASVCRSIDISRRREVLTFGHHQAVTSLTDEEQDELLTAAAKPKPPWTLARMRDEVKKLKARDLVLKGMPRSLADTWEAEAKAADQLVWEWLRDQIENATAQLEQAAQLKEAA